MSIDELIERLHEIQAEHGDDYEATHCEADSALLEYIGDVRVDVLHADLAPWYA